MGVTSCGVLQTSNMRVVLLDETSMVSNLGRSVKEAGVPQRRCPAELHGVTLVGASPRGV
eukprot:11152345-Alexandrium_andersonii.AAC.1